MNSSQSQAIVRLLTQNHNAMYRYIFALLGNADHANEVLQETSVALFEKAASYDQSKPFLPWAYRFAFIEVLKWRDKNAKTPMTLDDDVLELVAKNREATDSWLQQRVRHLPGCIDLLCETDRKAIQSKYINNTAPDLIAQSLGFTRRTLYRELERIRRVLMNCIESKLAAEEL